MKLVVLGTGQGGSNIADEFVAMGQWVWRNRRLRLFTGLDQDPIYQGVFAVNLGAGDLYGLQYIPQTDDHSIFAGRNRRVSRTGSG